MDQITLQLMILLLMYLGIILICILPILICNLIEYIQKHKKYDPYKHLDPKTFNKTIPYIDHITHDMQLIFKKP